jgi:hypothetical protein
VGKSSNGCNPYGRKLTFGVRPNVSPEAGSISGAALPLHRHHTHEKSAVLLRLLRQKARATRNKRPKEFYSIREVAGHFHVSLTTVSRIYTQLKTEGLLTTVWGSKTFIVPSRIDNALRMRGVVALPASLVSFCTLRQYRNFFSEICDALRKFGFATQFLFYEASDEQLPTFADRFSKHKLDIVIWFLPNPKLKETLARVLDHGIRVITVAELARDSREHMYSVDRTHAIRDALLNWRKDGIRFVTVLQNSGCRSSDTLTLLEKCLRDMAMPHALADPESLHLEQALAAPEHQATCGIVFASSEVAVPLVMRDPARFAKLAQRSRILLMDGPINAPGLSGTNLPCDVLELDLRMIAKTIVSDLVQPTRAWKAVPAAFRARWVPRTIETLALHDSVRHVTMFKRTGVGEARITA